MELHLNTVSDLLWDSLHKLMSINKLNSFRLVGGTSLSLQLGHRISVDIDLFSDDEYGSINFDELQNILLHLFPYVETTSAEIVSIGKSFYVGNDKDDLVKLDLFYTDPFAYPCVVKQDIRFASIEEVAAMKLEVISHGGRKKDFWDVHELLEIYSLDDLINFYLKRYPYGFSKNELHKQFLDFSNAEDDFKPNCLKDKDWEIIKLDFEDLIKK